MDEIEVNDQLDSDLVNVPEEDSSNSFDDEHLPEKKLVEEGAGKSVDDDEEAEKYSKKVQKRIDKLTARNYQAEAELQAERERRLQIEAELLQYRAKTEESELEKLKSEKTRLMEEGFFDEADAIDEKLHNLRTKKVLREQQSTQAPVQQEPAQAAIPQAQQAWLEQNDWFYNPAKEAQKQKANEAYLKLLDEGFDPEDPDTHQELNQRIGMTEKPKPPAVRPPSGVGPDRGSAVGERNGVKFSDIDAAKMRRWGLDPNDASQRAEYLKNKGSVAA